MSNEKLIAEAEETAAAIGKYALGPGDARRIRELAAALREAEAENADVAERLPRVADLQWELIDAKGARDTLQAKLDAVKALPERTHGLPNDYWTYENAQGYNWALDDVHAILTGATNA